MLCISILLLFTILRISMSGLSCAERFFSKVTLVRTLLCTQLKQTNLENQSHISTESSNEGFNDTVIQLFFSTH